MASGFEGKTIDANITSATRLEGTRSSKSLTVVTDADQGLPEKPFPFLQLPGEIRNLIYCKIFDSVTLQDPSSCPSCKFFGQRLPAQEVGRYSPHHVGIREKKNPRLYVHFTSDPAICNVNRQIQREAKSILLSKYLSFDISFIWLPETTNGLNMWNNYSEFREWSELCADEDLRSIRSIEIRDNVYIDPPSYVRTGIMNLPVRRTLDHDMLTRHMPILKISVTDDGNSLIVRSRLPLGREDGFQIRQILNMISRITLHRASGSNSRSYTGYTIAPLLESLYRSSSGSATRTFQPQPLNAHSVHWRCIGVDPDVTYEIAKVERKGRAPSLALRVKDVHNGFPYIVGEMSTLRKIDQRQFGNQDLNIPEENGNDGIVRRTQQAMQQGSYARYRR